VAIVSREAARRFWPGESPLGRRIRVHAGVAGSEDHREVVGVVGDVRLRSLGADPPPAIYLPQAQYPWDVPFVIARAGAGHRLSPGDLAATARSVDSALATWDAAPLADLLDASLAEVRFRSRLLSGFAAAALLLATLGLYGMLAFAVGERRRELGVRLALGARGGDVVRLILAGGLAPVALGAGIGLGLAAWSSAAVESALYGVAPLDPSSFVVAGALLLATSLAACLGPARRAARVDPVVALRVD
jgi:hypothetical protein